jgi:hypothetical protein
VPLCAHPGLVICIVTNTCKTSTLTCVTEKLIVVLLTGGTVGSMTFQGVKAVKHKGSVPQRSFLHVPSESPQ